MKTLSIVVAAALLGLTKAQARIGETLKELTARYPEQLQPQRVNSSGRPELILSMNDHIKVLITISEQGRSESEVFEPKNKGGALTKEEIVEILDGERSPKVQWNNFHANLWAAPVDEDQRELIAHSNPAHSFLEVCTLEYQQRLAAEMRKIELDGIQREAELKANTEKAIRSIERMADLPPSRKISPRPNPSPR